MDQRGLGQIADRKALATTVDSSISATTSVTLNADTVWVRVTALAKGIYVRSQAGVSTSAWDWYVPADSYVDIKIPKGVTILAFIEQAASATLILAEYD